MERRLTIELKDCYTEIIEIQSIKDYEIKYNPLGKYFMIHVLHIDCEKDILLQTDITIMKENFKYCYAIKEKENKTNEQIRY